MNRKRSFSGPRDWRPSLGHNLAVFLRKNRCFDTPPLSFVKWRLLRNNVIGTFTKSLVDTTDLTCFDTPRPCATRVLFESFAEMQLDDAEAWRGRAAELAAHAIDTLIIDQHNWYGVRRPQERAPGKLLIQRSGTLSHATVTRHFEGREVQHLLVVSAYAVIPSYHAVGGFGWLGFALEAPNRADEREARAAAWHQTLKLADHLNGLGLSVLTEHANGMGTYHVWLVLQRDGMADWEEIQSISVVAFVRRLLENLELPAEIFSPWLPLPGRHHTESWWSQFWRNGEWLRGAAGVDALLSMPTNPISLVKDVCTQYTSR